MISYDKLMVNYHNWKKLERYFGKLYPQKKAPLTTKVGYSINNNIYHY